MKYLKDICPFKLGVAVSRDSINKHRDLILREYNSITCDNALKLNYRIKTDGSYNFSEADDIYNFAISNGIQIRGHVIAWHIDFPDKLFGGLTRDELLAEIRRYIKTVSHRYPQIYAWDIVNEVIDRQSADILKRTPFYNIIGSDYIERIFEIAREEFGDNVALYMNEDDEWRQHKPENILSYAEYLLKNKIPIDGVGLQCHISPYENLSEYRTLFDGIRRLGLRCQITEMEVSVYDFDEGYYDACPAEIFKLQSDTYKYMFDLFIEYADIINLVCFWSISDKETWRDNWPVENRKDWPTLFDEYDNPKPVYYDICDKFNNC